jgi:hypothetical protein
LIKAIQEVKVDEISRQIQEVQYVVAVMLDEAFVFRCFHLAQW